MQIEEAKEYIKMIIRKQEIPDSAKALEYVYAVEAIDTVLNHIEKLEAESKNVVSRKKYRQTKKTLKWQINKLNAVIDVMAEWINKQDIDEEICKNNITQPELCNEYGTNCRQCIKEYFYKKVEGKE